MAIRRQDVDKIFKELALRETVSIDDKVLEMMVAKVDEVKTLHPDLDEIEAYMIAGRLLKQLISCYKSALDKLLP